MKNMKKTKLSKKDLIWKRIVPVVFIVVFLGGFAFLLAKGIFGW